MPPIVLPSLRMNLCTLRIFVLFTAITGLAAADPPPARNAAGTSQDTRSSTLARLQEEAARSSPDLQRIVRQIQSARAAGVQAGRWPNPTLAVSADRDEQKFALEQIFDLWAKLSLAKQISLTESELSVARLQTARLELRYEVARHFWAVATLEHQLALLERELEHWQKLFQIHEDELRLGEIAGSELLAAQNLASQRRKLRWQLVALTTTSRVALNVLTGRPPDVQLRLSAAEDVAQAAAHSDGAREAVRRALTSNPLLVQARARLLAAGFRLRQEERRWLPDPTLTSFVRNTPSQAFPGVGISFSVPIWDRNEAGIRGSAANIGAVQAELASVERAVAQEAFTALLLCDQERGSYEELRSLTEGPAARQLALLEQAFQQGALSERDILSARIEWSQRRQELWVLRGQVGLADARLQRALSKEEGASR